MGDVSKYGKDKTPLTKSVPDKIVDLFMPKDPSEEARKRREEIIRKQNEYYESKKNE